MNVNFKLETPRYVAEAREAKKGWNWFVELLVFVVMFFVVTFGEVLVMLPIELAVMFTDQGYLDAVASQDVAKITEAAVRIASSDALMIGMLFANIAMILLTMLFCKVIQKRKMRTLGVRNRFGSWFCNFYNCGIALRNYRFIKTWCSR